MAEVIATYDAGVDITAEASGAIVGGRFVDVPAARNAGGPTGISDLGDGNVICDQSLTDFGRAFGVAAIDAAAGRKFDVIRGTKTVPVECSVAIAIGQDVATGTDGRAKVFAAGAGRVALGLALTATSAAGQYCQVALYAAGQAST